MQESLMFRDHPEFENHDENRDDQPSTLISVFQFSTGGAAMIFLLLMVIDLAAPEPFVPMQLRWLAMLAAFGTLAIYLTLWCDSRNQRRHEAEMEAVQTQSKRTEYIRGYVDGLERNGFLP